MKLLDTLWWLALAATVLFLAAALLNVGSELIVILKTGFLLLIGMLLGAAAQKYEKGAYHMQFNKSNLKKMMEEIHKEASEEAQQEMELERKYGKIKTAIESRMDWTSIISFAVFLFLFCYFVALSLYGRYSVPEWFLLFSALFCTLFLLNESACRNLEPIRKGQFVLTEDMERIKMLAKRIK